MIIRNQVFALLIACGIGMVPAYSRADVMEQTDLYLVMSMAGVTAGSLKLSIDPTGEDIASSLKMKSKGLFKFLTGYKSWSEARSVWGSNGTGPRPVSYDSTYETKKGERKVLINYDRDDGQIIGVQAWKRGEPRKSKVPEELRRETIDPLTAVLQLRQWILNIRGLRGAEAENVARTFEIFDGRRRYRLTAELLDRTQIAFADEDRPALRFKVKMQPLAGFSKKDLLANWASEDGQRWIELIVTDDDGPIPLSLTTKGGTLETKVRLRKVCTGDGNCRKVDG